MPMIYTDERVKERAEHLGIDLTLSMTEIRDKVAQNSEQVYDDHLDAWEVRTGRPWTEMTREEAQELVRRVPEVRNNPGVLSRLYS